MESEANQEIQRKVLDVRKILPQDRKLVLNDEMLFSSFSLNDNKEFPLRHPKTQAQLGEPLFIAFLGEKVEVFYADILVKCNPGSWLRYSDDDSFAPKTLVSSAVNIGDLTVFPLETRTENSQKSSETQRTSIAIEDDANGDTALPDDSEERDGLDEYLASNPPLLPPDCIPEEDESESSSEEDSDGDNDSDGDEDYVARDSEQSEEDADETETATTEKNPAGKKRTNSGAVGAPTPKKQRSAEKKAIAITGQDAKLKKKVVVRDGAHLLKKTFTEAVRTKTEQVKISDCVPDWSLRAPNDTLVQQKKLEIRRGNRDVSDIFLRGFKNKRQLVVFQGQHELLALEELLEGATSAEKHLYEKVRIVIPAEDGPGPAHCYKIQSNSTPAQSKSTMREKVAMMELVLATSSIGSKNLDGLSNEDLKKLFARTPLPKEDRVWWLIRVALLTGEMKSLIRIIMKKTEEFDSTRQVPKTPLHSHFYISVMRGIKRCPERTLEVLQEVAAETFAAGTINKATKKLEVLKYNPSTRLLEYKFSQLEIKEILAKCADRAEASVSEAVVATKCKGRENVKKYAERLMDHLNENRSRPHFVRGVPLSAKSDVMLASGTSVGFLKTKIRGTSNVCGVVFGATAKTVAFLDKEGVDYLNLYLNIPSQHTNDTLGIAVRPMLLMLREKKTWWNETRFVAEFKKKQDSPSNLISPAELGTMFTSQDFTTLFISASSSYVDVIEPICKHFDKVLVSERASSVMLDLLKEKLKI